MFYSPTKRFTLIAGPCVLETRPLHDRIVRTLLEVQALGGIDVIFKASFDKANRTLLHSRRGPGLSEGLEMLADVKAQGLPVLTDVHEAWQVEKVAAVVDALQIPAFLSRQTDLLLEVARTGLPTNIKKGQQMGLSEMLGAIDKFRNVDAEAPLAITERGTFFGYGDLVVDFRTMVLLKETGCSVFYDGTHSLQRPGIGARRREVDLTQTPLIRAAAAVGVDGLFLEVHPRPEEAPSDGDVMLSLEKLFPLMTHTMAVYYASVR